MNIVLFIFFMKYCELCEIQVNDLTKHHLIPKTKHNAKLNKKLKQANININETINICSLCHTTIHALFSESELKNSINTLQLLKSHPKIQKYLIWRKAHPNFTTNSTKLSRI